MRRIFELLFRRRDEPRRIPRWEKIGAIVAVGLAFLILYRVSWDRDWFLWMIVLAPATAATGFGLGCLIAPRGFATRCFSHYEPKPAGRIAFYALAIAVLNISTSYALTMVVHTRLSAPTPAIIAEQAAAIRAATSDPFRQLQLVQATMLRCVQYDSTANVWGREHVPTVAEIFAERRVRHWVFPRGDCKARAVYAAALLRALGIDYRLESSLLLQHVWVSARAGGQRYDIGARMIGGSRDELLQALYLVGALRLTIDKLDPLWDPVATGEAPPRNQSALLGLTRLKVSGSTAYRRRALVPSSGRAAALANLTMSHDFRLLVVSLSIAASALRAVGADSHASSEFSQKVTDVAARIDSATRAMDVEQLQHADAAVLSLDPGSPEEAARSDWKIPKLKLWLKELDYLGPYEHSLKQSDLPLLNVTPPGPLIYDSGVSPAYIKDPVIRQKYIEEIEENKKKAERAEKWWRFQLLRNGVIQEAEYFVAEFLPDTKENRDLVAAAIASTVRKVYQSSVSESLLGALGHKRESAPATKVDL